MADTPHPDADLAILAPEMRRALMRHAPDYFSLSAEARELRRATWGSEGVPEIHAFLLEQALGKTPEEIALIEKDDIRLDAAEVSRMNSLMQQIRGIGEDFFSWNEWLGKDETALAHSTIGSYDRADHAFQQKARAEMDEDFEPTPYAGSLYCAWARILVDGHIRYLVMSDLAGYIYSELESATYDLLQEILPHSYVRGPKNGQPEGEFFLLDMHLDAGGWESLHRALSTALMKRNNARIEELRANGGHDEPPSAWLLSETEVRDGYDPEGLIAIFSGPSAMDQVRPRFFRTDCAAIAGDKAALKALVEGEIALLDADMRRLHAELLPQHPKGLVPFERKRRVLMAPSALEDLARISEEEGAAKDNPQE